MAHTDAEPPTSSETETQPLGAPRHPTAAPERPLLSWPVAMVVVLAGTLLLLLGGGVLLRQFTAPPTPATLAPTALVTLVPTLSAPTAPAAAPQTIAPATLPPGNTVAPTAVPTPRPTPAPTAPPTALPTSATQPISVAAGQSPEPTPLPTVPPELRREVETAYTQYWDARAEASSTLDPSPLDAVATGDELVALKRDVDQLRAEGRAIKTEVQHQYTVIRVDGDEAQVLDRFRDFSIYVDAQTKQPLPGEVRPDEANAPLNTALYYMRRIDAAWKVERGERYANN